MSETRIYSTDPSWDVFRWERHPLDAIFRPNSVAVVGASERDGSVGRTVLENLRKDFRGTIFPVNPNRTDVLGIRAYPSVAAIPGKVDLAVVITPAATVPGVIRECAAARVGGAIVISAGFKEIGEDGKKLEAEILAEARRGSLRIVGPNCLGVMNPTVGLNATFAQSAALKGNVAFLSQSGALCTAILDWSLQEIVGFSAFVSTGSMLDVGWGDLIYYFGDDPNTRSILIYMESIGDPRAFLSAAREVSRTKPIIVIKAGRTAAASKAAASHTGALTGSDEVLDAAFRRCGVLRVNRIAELFEMADVLSKQPRPRGPRLTIVTNAGGPGVLATDALLSSGGELAPIPADALTAFNALLPAHWSHNNPVDILGDADETRFARAVEIAKGSTETDGLLVILAPQGMTHPSRVAEQIAPQSQIHGVPFIASWMGGATVAEGAAIMNRAGIPTFSFPDAAARSFTYLWKYASNLRALSETPTLAGTEESAVDRARADKLIGDVRTSGRTLFTEWESKQLLTAYGIPTVRTELARDENEAARVAEQIGFPVVLKLQSETVTHKTDVGGVKLNLASEAEVRAAFREIQTSVTQKAGAQAFLGVTVQPMIKLEGYELILGSSIDSQFGPVLLFGAGGEMVEVFRDHALGFPPLTTTLARRMMERTNIYRALQGIRGRAPVDQAALEALVVRFSQLIAEQRWIKELDINPLLASSEGLVALDARVVLHPASLPESDLPCTAIRPYPTQYVSTFKMKNGAELRIRPIRPEDEPLMVQFHSKLSEATVYMRYMQHLKLDQRITHERLARICFLDYGREMALVAEREAEGKPELAGVARLSRAHCENEAEIAVLIRDDFQGQGLGGELLGLLLNIARKEKLTRVFATMLSGNIGMQRIAAHAGFQLERQPGEDLVDASIKL